MISFLSLFPIVIVLISFYLYLRLRLRKKYKIWEKLEVPFIPPCAPYGNFKLITEHVNFGIICKGLYEKLKLNNDFGGIYICNKPAILVTSPKLAKDVLMRDFRVFVNRGVYYNPKNDPISANLFFCEGVEWSIMRKKLSPSFSSATRKIMLTTLMEVGDLLIAYIRNDKIVDGDVDILDLMARFTTDAVSSCVLGLPSESVWNTKSELRAIGKKLMKQSKWKNFCNFLAFLWRKKAQKIGYCMFDKETNDYFFKMVKATIRYRRRNKIYRDDVMQMMIELMEKDEITNENLTLNEVVANAFIFFFAGFQTTSTTLTVCLYHLAFNPFIQSVCRNEIQYFLERAHGNLTYELLEKMETLDRIVNETLRIFPPVATLHRITGSDYKLWRNFDESEKWKTSKKSKCTKIPVGTTFVIPVLGFHHDNNIFKNADIFDPDRFRQEEKQKRINRGHEYSFLPFGAGQRNCIASNFALMQIKVCIVRLLTHFRVEPCDKTETSLKADTEAMTHTPKGPVWLKLCEVQYDP